MRRRWKKTMGTSKIRLVAVDMDGTLLNRERKITQYTQNVIRRAVSQGVVFAPATGRAVNALPQELKDMEEIRYGIFSNGATIYDLKEKKVLYKNQFEQKRILELMDFLKQFDVMQSYSMNGQSYAARKDMENVDYYQLDSNTKAIIHNSRKLINDLEDFLKEHDKTETVEKITLLFRTKEERAKVWKALEMSFPLKNVLTFSTSQLKYPKKDVIKEMGFFIWLRVLELKGKRSWAVEMQIMTGNC